MPQKVTANERLQRVFPELKIKTEGLVSKVNVDSLNGEDIIQLAKIIFKGEADLFCKRSGTGITVIVTEHPEGYQKS